MSAPVKNARRRAREFALQALYQHLVGRNDAESIDHFTRDLAGFHKADSVHYDALLHGCIEQSAELDALIIPLLDRKLEEISPVERYRLEGRYRLMSRADSRKGLNNQDSGAPELVETQAQWDSAHWEFEAMNAGILEQPRASF